MCSGKAGISAHLHMSLKASFFPTEIPAFGPFSSVFHTQILVAHLRDSDLSQNYKRLDQLQDTSCLTLGTL